jgi:hypothetical protein
MSRTEAVYSVSSGRVGRRDAHRVCAREGVLRNLAEVRSQVVRRAGSDGTLHVCARSQLHERGARQPPVVLRLVDHDQIAQRVQVEHGGAHLGVASGIGELRDDHCGQHRHDHDHDQDLDEREAPAAVNCL